MSPKKSKAKVVRNIGASIRARLMNIARESKRDYNRILIQYSQERLLYRFSISRYRNNFILKGALLFLTYDMPQYRPTKDIDFLGQAIKNDVDEIRKIIQEVAAIKVDDGIMFDPSSITIEQIVEQAEYAGIRVSVRASIGTAKIVMQVDIGFGDKIVAGPLDIEFPTILDFPAPHIKVYSLESAIAEKFEAIVRLNVVTSRMKDFYDIIYLSQHNSFKAEVLFKAITLTFETRGTPLSDCKIIWSDAFKKANAREKQWNAFHGTNKLELAGTWAESVEMIERFINPMMASETGNNLRNLTWNTKKEKWE